MKIFGFTIGKKDVTQVESPDEKSFALPTSALDDGAVTITQNAYFGTYVDLEGAVRNELELITRYREMSNHPELETAIDDIVNEAITHSEDGSVVQINTDNLNYPETIKKRIQEEFNYILKLLNFSNLADDLFRRWYIDGRIYFHVIVNEKNPKEGIQELRYIDPRKIRKIREINKERDPVTGANIIKSMAEYYVYNDKGTSTQTFTAGGVNQGIRVSPDSIVNVNSGLMDAKNTFVISFLHSCIRGDQRVKTVNGWKYMKDIIPGDEIYSYDDKKGGLYPTKVVNAWSNGEKETLTIKTRHTNLICTPDHLILTKNKKTNEIKYVRADELVDKNYLICLESSEFENIINVTPNEGLSEVFDLEVENENHNFIVNGMVVHNCIKPLNQLRMIEDAIVIYRLCLVGDTRIKTNNGWKYIKDIDEGDTVYSYWGPEKGLIETKVLTQWNTGTKQTYKVFSKHFDITGTDNHPILVLDNKTNVVEYVDIKNIIPKRHCFVYEKPQLSEEQEQILWDNLEKYLQEMYAYNIIRSDKKTVENIKEMWTSLGFCSTNIKKEEDGQYSIKIYEEKLNHFELITNVEEAKIEDVYELEVESAKHNFIGNGICVHNSRAPERRVFYIDVGNLPKGKAEQYLRDVMVKYRNKMTYDASTGQLQDSRKHLSMLEDFFLPRREGSRGTEITTLPPGTALNQIPDVDYFKKKLLQSLHVPYSRMDNDNGGGIAVFGRSAETSRDELKYGKFITRLRNKFSQIFDETLKIQLVLKGVCSLEEWEDIKEEIYFDYRKDNNFVELREAELIRERMITLQQVDPYIGKYFSQTWVKKKILRMTNDEIEDMEKEMQEDGSIEIMQQQIQAQQGIVPPEPVNNTYDAETSPSPTPNLDANVSKYSSQ